MEHLFEGQVGAAFFRTDAGEYGYYFQGSTRLQGRRTYFVKHDNRQLNSLEKQIMTKLNVAFQSD